LELDPCQQSVNRDIDARLVLAISARLVPAGILPPGAPEVPDRTLRSSTWLKHIGVQSGAETSPSRQKVPPAPPGPVEVPMNAGGRHRTSNSLGHPLGARRHSALNWKSRPVHPCEYAILSKFIADSWSWTIKPSSATPRSKIKTAYRNRWVSGRGQPIQLGSR